jgi:hypothetical protein
LTPKARRLRFALTIERSWLSSIGVRFLKRRDVKARSRTTEYYANNPEARDKKKAYDTKYHSTEERKKYRAFLNKKNRDAGTYGNGDGKDYDHDEARMIMARRNRSKK